MPAIILSDNGVSSGSAGLKTSGANDGILALQTTTAGGTATTAVTIGTDQSVTFAQSANLPNTFGFKNRIINGGMVIDQRNAGASQTIIGGASTLAFNCDRWQVRSAGANATVQQIVTNNTYRMRFTGAASVSAVAAQQSIEALNCVDLAGGNATLSLVASSTSLTSLTLEAYYANTTNTFGTWGSPTVTSIGSTTVNISSTESTVSWTFAVPSAATTGIQIRITSGALGAGQTLTIGQVQLERGSTATSFDYRPYGTELMLCQRYYERQAARQYISYTSGNVSAVLTGQWSVTKRATPTVSVSSDIATLEVINTASALGSVAWSMGVSGTGATGAFHGGTITGSIEL